MVVPNHEPHVATILHCTLDHGFDVPQATASAHIGHHEKVDIDQVELVAASCGESVSMKREILMNVGSHPPRKTYHGPGEEPLQGYARGQRVEVGRVVRGDELHAGSNVS